jgi:hypothetical protein
MKNIQIKIYFLSLSIEKIYLTISIKFDIYRDKYIHGEKDADPRLFEI